MPFGVPEGGEGVGLAGVITRSCTMGGGSIGRRSAGNERKNIIKHGQERRKTGRCWGSPLPPTPHMRAWETVSERQNGQRRKHGPAWAAV